MEPVAGFPIFIPESGMEWMGAFAGFMTFL
jgi:hypothetical protein